MRFGLLYELQLPRPWLEMSEHKLFQDALSEVEAADRLGYDYVWANEHHFLEEYSHNSAPEVFLAACAARTRQIHVGHAVVLSPPGYNAPARVAERIATLDLISSGRVEWGTGQSASRTELEGFNVELAQKKAKLEQYGRRVWNVTSAEAAIAKTEAFFNSIGMPTRLQAYNISTGEAAAKISARFAERKATFGEHGDIGPAAAAAILRLRA